MVSFHSLINSYRKDSESKSHSSRVRTTVHGILQARILVWVAFLSPGDLPNPGIEPRSSALRVDSSPAEPRRKPPKYGTLHKFASSANLLCIVPILVYVLPK